MTDLHTTPADFTDLEIRLLRHWKEGYSVEITLSGQQEFPRGNLTTDILKWSAENPATDGQKLFDLLMADANVRSAWAEARGQAPRRRIRLRIDADAPELHALPWELLQDSNLTLAAGSDTPFSRYLPIALPWGGEIKERPIRVLVVISDPDDLTTIHHLPQANVTLERQALTDALGEVKDLTVKFLDAPVTLEKIEAELRQGYHVLHFLGHGAFDSGHQKARLYLQDEQGHTQRVLDDQIVNMLARQGGQLRLVFLAACQSATRDSANAFLGLGPKLVSAGVPAVVAMQDFVTVETARKFSSVFYTRLMEHSLVDRAMNDARSALLTAGRPDAAVPVLFMRLKSGQLWSAEANARGKVLGKPDSSTVWAELIETIQAGECTPIIGPRVHGRWLPTSEEVARRWAKAYHYPFADRETTMARVAQFMAATLNEFVPHRKWLETLTGDFIAHLPEELRPAKYKTLTELIHKVDWPSLVADDRNEPHSVLASLNLPLYLTTNCDSFMTEALAARQGIAPVREVCRWNKDLDRLPSRFEGSTSYEPTPEAPLVYHLFGTDAELGSLVITEDNYLDYALRVSEKGRIPDYIRGVLGSTSLMFIGYSLNDLDFRVLMRGLIATVDRRLATFQDVAVQLEGASEADAAAVQEYLSKYFAQAKINVFWGNSAQFIAELREQWEAGR